MSIDQSPYELPIGVKMIELGEKAHVYHVINLNFCLILLKNILTTFTNVYYFCVYRLI